MVQETKLGLVIALPLVSFLIGMLFVSKTLMLTQEDFMLFAIVGLVLWVVGLIGMYGYLTMQAVKYRLFDREFGYDSRLHPRCEIYCKPEDIRVILDNKTKIENLDKIEEALTNLGFEDELTQVIKKGLEENPKTCLLYFRHKDTFEGWDNQHGVVKQFSSHMILTEKSFTEQFEFSAGQENWYGPILYNHPSAESDNMKVLGWSLDPFTSAPMPIGFLVHWSRKYNQIQKEQKEIDLVEAQQRLITYEHGLIENYRKETANLQSLQDAKLHDVTDISKHGHKIAEADFRLEDDILEPPRKRLWDKGWFKVLLTIATLAAIVIIIGQVLGWIDLTRILG